MNKKKCHELRAFAPTLDLMKSSQKAVRPQNRHLRPWKKGDANIPKSPGRPRTAKLLAELNYYLIEHDETLNEYLRQRTKGKKRLHRILDALMKRQPALLLIWAFGKPH
jgi:hypothetical protein